MSLEAEIENIKEKGGIESQHHLQKRKKLTTQSKDFEIGTFVPIGKDFNIKLGLELQSSLPDDDIKQGDLIGMINPVLKEKFQADSLIACRRLNGQSDLIFFSR